MFFSWTNPNSDESLLGILTCPDVLTTDFNDEGEVVSEKIKQLVSIGLIILRIDILW